MHRSNHVVLQEPFPCTPISICPSVSQVSEVVSNLRDKLGGQNQPDNGEVDLEEIQLKDIISNYLRRIISQACPTHDFRAFKGRAREFLRKRL